MKGEDSPLNRLPRDEVADALMSFMIHGLADGTMEKKMKGRTSHE